MSAAPTTPPVHASSLSVVAIKRIVSEAGFRESRPFLDFGALSRCIDVCNEQYEAAKRFKKNADRAVVTDRLRAIAAAASQLKQLLPFKYMPCSEQFMKDLSRMTAAANRRANIKPGFQLVLGIDHELQYGAEYIAHLRSKSTFQWLAGYLWEVYDIFFPGGKSYGKFASRVIIELRIKDPAVKPAVKSVERARRQYSLIEKRAPQTETEEWAILQNIRLRRAIGIDVGIYDPTTELLRVEEDKALAASNAKSGQERSKKEISARE